MFIASYSFSYDKNKPSILVIKALERYSYIFGFVDSILNELSKKYNIFILSFEQIKNTSFNTIKIKEQNIKKEIENICYRKNDFDDSLSSNRYDYNHQALENLLYNSIPNLKSLEYIIIGYDLYFILPYTKYFKSLDTSLYNEFFDYVGNNKDSIEKITNNAKEFSKEINKYISPFAFSQIRQCIILNTIRAFIRKYKSTLKSIDTFIIDPAQFHFLYETFDVPYRCFYFENDKRGTRNFIKFPIAQIQHCVFDYFKQTNKDNSDNNRKLFMFAGSIFSNKESRKIVWKTFLKDLYIENSSLYIPLAKGRVFQVEPTNKILENNKEKIIENYSEEFYNEVKYHKMYNGHILPENLYEEIGNYKYSFIPRCVSYKDSLNFRPILYVQNNVLPLLDDQYDPSYLMIPKEIQDKIVVKDYKDIEEKVKYFEEHTDEKNDILNKLKDLFNLDKFYNSDYVSEIINSTWN